MQKLKIFLFILSLFCISNSCREKKAEKNPFVSPSNATLVSTQKEDVKKIQEAINPVPKQTSTKQATQTKIATKTNTSTTTLTYPPGAFTITNVSSTTNSATVYWGSSVYATTYKLERGTSFGSYQTIGNALTVSSFQDKDLTPNTLYYYKLSAENKYGTTNANYVFSVRTQNSLPENFTVRANTIKCTVSLSWDNPIGATNYIVSRSVSATGPLTLLTSTAISPFVDNGTIGGALTQGQNYYYLVSAANSAGYINAPQVTATIKSGTACDTIVRSTPGAFTVQSITFSEQQAQITWTASSGARNYIVRRGTAPYSYPTIVSTSATSPFIDSGLDNNTNYYYMVSAASPTTTVDATLQLNGANISSTKTPSCFLKTSRTGDIIGPFPNDNASYAAKITQSQCEQQEQSCQKASGTCTAWLFH